jgi:hypothetical protein
MAKEPIIYLPTGQCCELDEPYQAPPGYFDQPFIYVFDADSLTDGIDYRRLNVTTFSGADFLMRRVGGQDRAGTNMQLRDVLARLVFNDPFNTNFQDFPVVPELMFPAATDITLDLLPVQRFLKTDGVFNIPLSQIVFQGVRRFKGYRRPPSYPYWEDEFSYPFELTIDWDFRDTRARRFAINIEDCDFELLQITEDINNIVPPGFDTSCKFQLYDQVNEQVFSAPVIDDLIMDNSTDYAGIVPVPGIVYRIGQQIRFDITSLLLPAEVPGHVVFWFHGVRRRPC